MNSKISHIFFFFLSSNIHIRTIVKTYSRFYTTSELTKANRIFTLLLLSNLKS